MVYRKRPVRDRGPLLTHQWSPTDEKEYERWIKMLGKPPQIMNMETAQPLIEAGKAQIHVWPKPKPTPKRAPVETIQTEGLSLSVSGLDGESGEVALVGKEAELVLDGDLPVVENDAPIEMELDPGVESEIGEVPIIGPGEIENAELVEIDDKEAPTKEIDFRSMSWGDLQRAAADRDIFQTGMTKAETILALEAYENQDVGKDAE